MIGVDIADIARFQNMKNLQAFLTRTFTERERAYLAQKKDMPQCIAGMFAAKEAVAKALGTGFSEGVGLRDIEILHDALGKPTVSLHARAEAALQQDMGGTIVYVSISHSDLQAVAVATIR